MDLESLRREYLQSELHKQDLENNPLDQFKKWLKEAIDSKVKDPTAMTMATSDKEGQPSQRIVLLKYIDTHGFIFYTNYDSKKATDIIHNPMVSLHFPWNVLNRQVTVMGIAKKISRDASSRYFISRPIESQQTAWASKQSDPIASKKLLIEKVNYIKKKFQKKNIPVPEFWGGYKVFPRKIEFWQGGARRLHDRFLYTHERGKWYIERLAP